MTLSIIRRDSVDLDLTFTDKDDNPIDLTGCTVFFTVKKNLNHDDDKAVIRKNITTHTFAVEGKTRISLSIEDTDLFPRYYFYDVQIKNLNNQIISANVGKLKVEQDATIRTE